MTQYVDRIGSSILYRGSRPDNFLDLFTGNIKTDINLEVGFFDFFTGKCREEQDWCTQAACQYVHMPMSDFIKPNKYELQARVKAIQQSLTYGNVLVHCLHGEDRTGLVIAAYRILVNRWTYDAAVKEMLSFGYHTFPYGWWIDSLQGLGNAG
jgi:protein tyrosine/serine phosphatase